jgi:hypothetical protein
MTTTSHCNFFAVLTMPVSAGTALVMKGHCGGRWLL